MKISRVLPVVVIIAIIFVIACENEDPAPSLKASFTISSNPAYAGDTVYFENTSTGAVELKWFFGDGTASSEESPTHVYAEGGEYTITLEITNNDRSDNTSKNITVMPQFEQWVKHVIDADVSVAVSVEAADIDGDNDLDLVVTSFGNNDLIWYENNSLSWTKHIINSDASGVTFAFCGDMDDDGTMDVVASQIHSDQLLLYRNTEAGWVEHIIDDPTDNADFIEVVDINGDDRLDVVTAGDAAVGGDVIWYENQHPDWIEHIIEAGTEKYPGPVVCDIDGDGLPDVASAMVDANKVVWFKNENNGLQWTKYTIDDNILNPFAVNHGDINGDAAMDLLVTTGGPYFSGSQLVWYENNYPDWTRHEIDNDLAGAAWPTTAYLDDNNKIDIIAGGYKANDLLWYEYDEQSWNKYFIDDNLIGPRLFIVLDLNHDHLNDVIVAALNSVVWYEQKEK